ncbi:MAG TPA: HAMP domain-containing sensor histidine kinase [Daejeonella sp.]
MVNKLWNRLIGATEELSLENRLLNASCLLSLATLLVYTIYDFFVIVLPQLAVATAITFIVQSYLYYLSRVKGRFQVARIGFTIGSYVFMCLNYYYSAGLDGPSIFGFFLTLAIVLVIMPKSQQWVWTIIHCLIVPALIWLDYTKRISVPNVYISPYERYLDNALSYIILMALLAIVVSYVLKNYARERSLAQERAKSLAFVNSENTRLFSIISHDLRSPLNSIQGYLELLGQHALNEQERGQVEEQLLMLTKNTSDMLFNLLAWSKSQLTGSNISLVANNLKGIIASTLEILRHVADKKNIAFTAQIPVDLFVIADAEMLQLVIRNLIYNAIKFTPEGGKVEVLARAVDNACVISVKDNGVGIPVEKQPLVFSTQIKSSVGTQSEKGIGLGLLLCKDFTELQNGKIWFESQEGTGSTFYVSVPLTT